MTDIEYMLSDVMEPHLYVIRKQKRENPEKVTPMLSYYLLDGSIYQAPPLCNIFVARIVSFSSILSSSPPAPPPPPFPEGYTPPTTTREADPIIDQGSS
ncbi:hypothetical protein LWI28_009311 [Acer negundo]|uniref:Mediator of RNA polymerase II transcription subunit 6 n=1 Tax=Acer negundo TaxID=4023 RepID=A0AAD5IE76_ACENE|nr:hypothetical protein LWI28_009311 [Acer negundo]